MKRRIVREPERLVITGISKTRWWMLEQEGRTPNKIKIGPRAIGWVEDELYEFNEQLIAERDKQLESAAG